ncbi:MAG: PilN domain-containing protein [Rhodocyclaceae bacterium]|jgi:type IV pilus assembly protein PilN|nr:PilN domain-containing protein [Rhodocyclaceae bacterium]
MMRINLLPHREEKRKARRHQFWALSGMVTVLAGLIWFLGYTIINGRITAQMERNDFLSAEISSLDKEIAEIKKLKQQTDAFLARKRVIEALQANRTETIHLFNELSKRMPDGVYLKALKQTGPKLALTGMAQSNARITALMDALEASTLLESPTLVLSTSEVVGGRRLNAFSVEIQITNQTLDNADSKEKAGKKK